MNYYKEDKRILKEELLEIITHHRNYEYSAVEYGNEKTALEDNISPNSEEVKYSIRKMQDEYDKKVIIKTLKELVKEIK